MDESEDGTPGLDDKSAGRHDEDPKADFDVHEADCLSPLSGKMRMMSYGIWGFSSVSIPTC